MFSWFSIWHWTANWQTIPWRGWFLLLSAFLSCLIAFSSLCSLVFVGCLLLILSWVFLFVFSPFLSNHADKFFNIHIFYHSWEIHSHANYLSLWFWILYLNHPWALGKGSGIVNDLVLLLDISISYGFLYYWFLLKSLLDRRIEEHTHLWA